MGIFKRRFAAKAAAVFLLLVVAGAVYAWKTHLFSCGRSVSSAEWEFYQNMFRAEVSAHYYLEYGMDLDTAGSWNVPCEGQTASQMLARLARGEIARDDALRQLAQELGAEPMDPFSQMARELEEVNARRAADKNSGLPVYGTEAYTIQTYYLEQKSACETAIVGALMQQALQQPAILQDAYEQMQPEDFLPDIETELVLYQIDAEEYARDPNAVTKGLSAVEQSLRSGQILLAEQAQELTGFPVVVSERQLKSKEISREDSAAMQLLGMAKEAEQGGCFFPDEQTLVYVKTLRGLQKPALSDCSAAVAAWYANRMFEESIPPRC